MTVAMDSNKTGQDVSDGKTIFIRNLSFDTEQEDLQELMKEFGDFEYCVVCVDHVTGHPKGSAFVKFRESSSADSCLEAAANQDERLFVDGRRLYLTPALPRTHIAQKLADNKRDRDKRNLYLAKEGLIYDSSPAAEGVSQFDLEKRLTLEQRKRRLLQDITRFISGTRLCVHNLPGDVDDKKLRALFKEAVSDSKAKITEARVMRNRKESSNKLGKSSGFGFVEFAEHAHALEALRKLNNNPETFTDTRRPIVEFSVESKKALNKKMRQKAKNEKAKNKKSPVKKESKAKGKKDKKEVQENSSEQKAVAPVNEEDDDEIPYSGLKSRPLKVTEKVAAPKMNRKMFEAKKKLKERRKNLKKELKSEKTQKEHVAQKEDKLALKRGLKQTVKAKEKRKDLSDLDAFEASFLQKKRKAVSSATSFKVTTIPVKREKWYTDTEVQ